MGLLESCLVLICLVVCLPAVSSSTNQSVCRPNADFSSEAGVELKPSLKKHEAGLLLLLGFGGFSVILAIVYNFIRSYVYEDVNNVDSTFDAGGDVSSSLTAVTIAAQLLWPADLMQSVTFAVKYGIAGAFWYYGAIMLNLSLFPMLSFKFKTKAPGAKTFLQIILARFGKPPHLIFCFFALLLNIVIISTILVGGIAIMQATIEDVSPTFCLITIVTLCGSYCFIGGLGSTFYVSYFNAFITFAVLSVLIINIIYSNAEPFGSLEEIYERVNCMSGIEGNRYGSRFTFLSEGASIVCVQSIFLVASITYCDQASWQSRIAAKPLQGAIGFLFGAFVWFSVPASIGLITGLTYVSEAAINANVTLSMEQIDSGITSTFMAQRALGTSGVVMMLTMITMLTMSTGSGEIMSISAIIIYDIYQTYINPYRKDLPHNGCILCGNGKADLATKSSTISDKVIMNGNGHEPCMVCNCPSVVSCPNCKTDVEKMNNASSSPGKVSIYTCPYHGAYRTYQNSLINFKNWCVLWVSICLIPFGLVLHQIGINLNWIMLAGSIMTVPCFPGVVMSVLWVKLSTKGIMTGAVVGFFSGIFTNIVIAYVMYEGKGGFFKATSHLYAVLGGAVTSGTLSLILTTVISLRTHEIETEEDKTEVWESLRNIDNPLHPWGQQFAEAFPELSDGALRPTKEQIESIGRSGRLVSIGGSIAFTIIFLGIIPGSMTSLEILSSRQFQSWAMFITAWLVFAASIIITVTPVEEVYRIVKTYRNKLRKRGQTQTESPDVNKKTSKMNGRTTTGKTNNSDLKDIENVRQESKF